MPSLLETDPTRNAAVSMWKLASTRRAHNQPDQEQIRRTLQTELQSRDKQITRNETRTSSLAAITLEMTLCVKRCLQKTVRNTMGEWIILDRWYKDERYRTTQAEEHGWTVEWVKVPRLSRHSRYRTQLSKKSLRMYTAHLGSNDSNLQTGPVRNRPEWREATKSNGDSQSCTAKSPTYAI